MVGRVLLAAVSAVALILFAMSLTAEHEGAAIETAQEYLRAACDPKGDRGWSMLEASQRSRHFDSEGDYVNRGASSDCGRFSWHVGAAHCDDGVCVVWLSVPDSASIPAFLSASGIIQYREEKVPAGMNAGMAVLQRWILGDSVVVPED